LDQTLHQLTGYLERMATLRRKVVGAVTYPIFLITFTFGAVIFLVVKIVPVFQRIYGSFGAKLPAPTRLLLTISSTMRQYGLFLFLAMLATGVLLFLLWRSQSGRYFFDRWILGVPVVGSLLRKFALTKFTRTLGVLISSGVPILASLDLVAETAGNRFLEKAIRESAASIERGKSFAESLSQRGRVFPEMLIQMTSTGEESGTLDKMLGKVANFYEQQIETIIVALTSLLEPVLIVIIGGVIGSILLSIFLPVFKMGRAIH